LAERKGIVLEIITTSANTSDTTQIIPLDEKAGLAEETMILADKGYTSQKNRTALKGLKLEDGIMPKATRGKPLTESQKSLNSLISGTRWVIGRTFGSIIRWFHSGRCRYRGLRKTHCQNFIDSLAYNLKRAPQLIMQQNQRKPL
jgi:IS5 family transposase